MSPSRTTLELSLLPPAVNEGFDHFGCEVVRRNGDAVEGRVSLTLHACSGAALLGKQVTMLDKGYGKNNAVFTHSLAGRHPTVMSHEGTLHAE